MAEIEMKWTDKYDQFKYVSYNRDVDHKRVEKIIEIIRKNGFLVPILVNQDGIVVDGQHRLDACRRSKTKVAYVTIRVENDKLPLIMSELNSSAKTWTDKNYFDMWLDLEKEVFVYINSVIVKHNVQFKNAWQIFMRLFIKSADARASFKNGTFAMTETQRIAYDDKLSQLAEIRDSHERFSEFPDSFLGALVCIITKSKYKHEIMLEAINSNPGFLLRAKSQKDYIVQLEDLYDRSVRSKKDKISTKR